VILTERQRGRWRKRRSRGLCRADHGSAPTGSLFVAVVWEWPGGRGYRPPVEGWPGQPCIARVDCGTHDQIPWPVETRRRQTSSAAIGSFAAVARPTRVMSVDGCSKPDGARRPDRRSR
jgi:hypothetical protein